MAVLWLSLELIMVFFYYDLPTVKNDIDDQSTDDEQHGYEYSGENNSILRNSVNNSVNVQATENKDKYLVTSDMIRDLTSRHSSVLDGEKQKLITTAASQKRVRTGSVMDKWNLAKGMLGLLFHIHSVIKVLSLKNPSCDYHVTPPHSIHALSMKQVLRKLKVIR